MNFDRGKYILITHAGPIAPTTTSLVTLVTEQASAKV